MKKKVSFFFIFNFIGIMLFAQCPVSVSITPSPSGETCKNTPISFTANPTNGGTNPIYYWMINGDTVSNAPSISSTVNGAHVELIMFSNSGCALDSTYSSYYVNSTTIHANYNVINEECNQPVADVQITDVVGGAAPYTYYILTSEAQIQGTDYFKDIATTSYPLVITDAKGCVDTSWIDVVPIVCPPIIPIEIFTPNHDGYNDVFTIINIEFYPKNKVYIFDRWGQRVYYKDGYTNVDGWDAKYLATDMPVSSYFYIVELEFNKQDTQVFKGPVSILR